MHILISALHRPTKPTGVCRHAANLAQCLADTPEVSKVTLIVGVWQQDYFQLFFHSPKIQLITVDIKNNSFTRNIWFLFGLPKLVKQFNPDIVHLSFPFPFLRPLFPCPVVSTIHDLYPYEKPEVFGYPNVIFNRLFLKQSIEHSDALTCVSQSTLSSLKSYFPQVQSLKPITVIYNYVDFSDIIAEVPTNLDISDQDYFSLCVAQHRKNKNLDLLIRAFYLLKKNEYLKDNTKLIIVGSTGPETENLLQLIHNLSLQEQVLLIHTIKDHELCWLYQKCQVFIAASSEEGFCLPLAEALYFSSPVVCADIPIFREIGNSNCCYFDLQGDAVQNLSQAIISTLEKPLNPTNNDLRFSKLDIAGQYLKFYSTLDTGFQDLQDVGKAKN
ncbi:glycosyltransferase family 4 protein [Cuspidothrix issatschenkoi]|uniref:Glycosyltransferase family 1 protein n=1 Tax=Cuspidothrix issatschenkoi CHARLIE-1 TaxID=2052836 RepID=A0A2S6CV59_9CYAN|nr:glycosyltransferase family 1 protein [Cuspidothrix issatschenkoi]PPJ63648.1 glycosyltransferase family 1 protein [Cuspidothrix issatschenkoi CHARLIE-1]